MSSNTKENNHNKKCPKCYYIRQADDYAPEWQCPNCGIAYTKFKAATTPGPGNLLSGGSDIQWFRTLRIFFLLVLLFFVGMSSWLTRLRTTDWDNPLWVVVYPINGDNSLTSSNYIESLRGYEFEAVEHFIRQEAKHYALTLKEPVTIKLAPRVDKVPPRPPDGGSMLSVIWWSLKTRYWAYTVDTYNGPAAEIQIFVVYYDPETNKLLKHSLGLEKGLIGIANAFADKRMTAQNNLVIAHELLHTVGATDKYDSATDQPVYPHGYAEPDKRPLLPQSKAEIMAGSIPLSKGRSEMPLSLKDTVIGITTAKEIRWIN